MAGLDVMPQECEAVRPLDGSDPGRKRRWHFFSLSNHLNFIVMIVFI